MKRCVDCRFFDGKSYANCEHPGRIDYVYGDTRAVQHNLAPAQHMREDPAKCGPDAVWFEPLGRVAG